MAAAPLVLLCDPDADTREIYSAILRHHGMSVLEAVTASAAIDLARRERLAAVVTELLDLPGGETLPYALLTNEQTKGVRVFVITTDIRPDRQRPAAEAGALIRLKPFAPRDLTRLVLDT